MSKKIEKPENFLVDSGLLFEINRTILHPLGIALALKFEDDGTALPGIKVLDSRDDPEGYIFPEDLYNSGQSKINKYMEEFGDKALESRRDLLGFGVQKRANYLEYKMEKKV